MREFGHTGHDLSDDPQLPTFHKRSQGALRCPTIPGCADPVARASECLGGVYAGDTGPFVATTKSVSVHGDTTGEQGESSDHATSYPRIRDPRMKIGSPDKSTSEV